MALQFAATIRTAMSQAIETDIGTAPILRIRTGAAPANVAAASTGTVLASITLPADWCSHASGVLTKTGTWEDTAADAAGTAAHFEIVASDGTTRKLQGTVTATGGGGDLQVDNVVFAVGQAFTVTTFTITMGNA